MNVDYHSKKMINVDTLRIRALEILLNKICSQEVLRRLVTENINSLNVLEQQDPSEVSALIRGVMFHTRDLRAQMAVDDYLQRSRDLEKIWQSVFNAVKSEQAKQFLGSKYCYCNLININFNCPTGIPSAYLQICPVLPQSMRSSLIGRQHYMSEAEYSAFVQAAHSHLPAIEKAFFELYSRRIRLIPEVRRYPQSLTLTEEIKIHDKLLEEFLPTAETKKFITRSNTGK